MKITTISIALFLLQGCYIPSASRRDIAYTDSERMRHVMMRRDEWEVIIKRPGKLNDIQKQVAYSHNR